MSDMNITPEQMKNARERMRMTQAQLAEEAGVSLRTVSSWERGESSPLNRSAVVAEILGINTEDEGPEFGTAALLLRIGHLAKRRREEIGMGRAAFAKEAGLGSDRTLMALEFGRTLPTGTTQHRIERALGWRIGAIEDVMRMVNRKAEEIRMQELDAEDSLYLDAQTSRALSSYSDDELLDELRRRLKMDRRLPANLAAEDPENLYGLAASMNSEHLEDEDGPEA